MSLQELRDKMIALKLSNAHTLTYVEYRLCSDGEIHTGWVTGRDEWHHSQRDFYAATFTLLEREVSRLERILNK